MDSPASVQSAKVESGGESIKVLVRVRPLNQAELAENNDSVVSILNDQSLNVTSADGKKSFRCSFDSVLGPTSTQTEVYSVVRSCTESVIEGFNSTIFAYGQTGSGKTHSMYGPPNYVSGGSNMRDPRNAEMMGLIPRAIDEIFELAHKRSITDFQVHCSFVQIYNENLYDMLRDSSMNTPLSIRDNNKEIYVQGLSEYNVKSVADTLQLLKIAEDNRAIRETNMNMFSSRSHSIFQIQVEHKRVAEDGGEISYKAKFNLVDLAGSEKWNTKLHMRDEHIAEMTNINLSLHTLGKCISALAQASHRQNLRERESESRAGTRERTESTDRSLGSLDHSGSTAGSMKDFPVPKNGRYSNNNSNTVKEPTTHVPFRESKLTRLLQDSLGGNAKTFLIATISPARSNSEESISTLKFADRAKQVMVQAVINETRPVDYALVKRLQQEVEMLKSLLKRVVQSQQGGGNVNNASLVGSPGQFNAKLKQATTASDFQNLFGTGTGSVVPSGANSPVMHLGGQYHYGGTETNSSGASLGGIGIGEEPDAPAGGGLEYVISLEKALNQEQIHSQHLSKKNETLIKELEELKFQNMQLMQTNKQSALTAGLGAASSVPPLARSISINRLAITSAQVNQVIASVQALLKENATLMEQTEQVQKVMKKFFKFQIEEDDMKGKVEAVFAAVKEIKASSASNNVTDNFAFLEFLATNASKGSPSVKHHKHLSQEQGSPPRQAHDAGSLLYSQTPGGVTSGQNSFAQGAHLTAPGALDSAPQPGTHAAHVGRKQLRRQNEPAGGHLPSMQAMPAPAQMTTNTQPKSVQKSAIPYRQPVLQPLQGAPTSTNGKNHYSTEVDTTSSMIKSSSQGANQRRHNFSAGSDDGYLGQAEEDFARSHHHQQHAYQSHQNHQNALAPLQQPQLQPQPQQSSNLSHVTAPSQYAPPQPLNNLSYRVRGGPTSGPLSNSSQNSLQSSGGWVVPTGEDAAAAEEQLKQELKKAKKKIKKQQKMQEWQRIKDDKLRAEQEAEAAQRAAEEEAELQKELKRKQYAQKAKSKLDAYYSKVKTEAEKIQELKNLGIDPSSLF